MLAALAGAAGQQPRVGPPQGWEANRNGFLRQKGAAYSLETRYNVARLYDMHEQRLLAGDLTMDEFAMMAGPSKQFCSSLIAKYTAGQSLEPLPTVPNPVTIFDDAGIAALYAIYDDNPR